MAHVAPFVLVAGRSLQGTSLGFHAYSMRIDNISNQWLQEQSTLTWIPPYSLGVIVRLWGTSVALLLATAPQGQPQLAAIGGEYSVAVYSDEYRTENPGVPVRQFTLVQSVSDLTEGPQPALPPVGVCRIYADPNGVLFHIHSDGNFYQLIDTHTALGGALTGTLPNPGLSGTGLPDKTWFQGGAQAGGTGPMNLFRKNEFGYGGGTTYGNMQLNSSVAMGVDVSTVAGGNFNANNELIIPNSWRITQVNAGGTDFLNAVLNITGGIVTCPAAPNGGYITGFRYASAVGNNDTVTGGGWQNICSMGLDIGTWIFALETEVVYMGGAGIAYMRLVNGAGTEMDRAYMTVNTSSVQTQRLMMIALPSAFGSGVATAFMQFLADGTLSWQAPYSRMIGLRVA